MIIGSVEELIEQLQKLPQDAKVLHESSVGALVPITSTGWIRAILVRGRLVDGYEWRIPRSDKDEADAQRIVVVIVK